MRLLRCIAVAFCLFLSIRGVAGLQPGALPPLPNGDFAKGEVGATPEGWHITTAGLTAALATDADVGNGRAVKLTGQRTGGGGAPFSNFLTSFDAAPYRGKQVLLRFRLRVTTPGSAGSVRAQPWVRVDRPGEVMGWFDNCGERPVIPGPERGAEYKTVSMSGKIDDDAQSINVGVMVFGSAIVWVQSVSLEETVIKDLNAPAAPLTDRGLENIRAFALMYGQVKYFHPSDEAYKADWARIASEGVQRVEACADAAALAAALSDVFAGVGAGVQVWAGGVDAGPAAPAAPPIETRVIGWQHMGVSFGPEFTAAVGPSAYRSMRIKEEAGDGNERKLPKPGTCATGSAGGISWRIPVVLPLDERGSTTPPASGKPLASTRPDDFHPSGGDRVTRLADVIAAWNVFQHFYPYFDVTPQSDWNATLVRSLKSAATDADDRAFVGTLRLMVADLRDGHGNVYKNDLRPQKGLPCGWRLLTNGEVIVTSGGEGGADGLHAGDRIVKVDGQPIGELIETQRSLTSGATQQWRDFAAARSLLLYAPKADPSVVEVDRAGAQLTLHVPLVLTEKLVFNDPPRPANGTVLGRIEGQEKGEIVYFNIDGAKNPALTGELDHLHDAAGIVFDLRGYPGDAGQTLLRHLTAQPIQSARWIVPTVTMPNGEKGGGWEWTERGRWNLTPAQPRFGGGRGADEGTQAVVFITDGRAISYAESCMGIVEAYKLGEIVGGPTAGTNGNINPFTLPGGYSVIWTGMRVLKHDGSRHHGVGIAPTVPCEPTREGLAAGKDELLEKAVDVIKRKLATP